MYFSGDLPTWIAGMDLWVKLSLLAVFAVVLLVVQFVRQFLICPAIALPRPTGHWLLGNVPELGEAQAKGVASVLLNQWQTKLGPMYGLWAPGRYTAVLAEPTAALEVLHQRHRFHRDDLFRTAFQLVSNGLLVLEDDVWLMHRRTVSPAFNTEHLRDACTIINRVTEQMLAQWETSRLRGAQINAHRDVSNLTMDVIGLAAFAQDLGSIRNPDNEMARRITEGTDILAQRITLPQYLWRWMLPGNAEAIALTREVSHAVAAIIQQRQESGAPHPQRIHNLLDMLLTQRKQGDEGSLSDEAIRDEILMFFVAGHETTGNAISFALYALAEEIHVVKKLQEEIDRVVGTRRVTYEELPELTYLDMVIKEVLRLYPVVPITGRQCVGPEEVNGVHLPQGSNVLVNIYGLQRNPAYWTHPEEFRPERFEEGKKPTPGTYMPFGDGPKNCIGQRFAVMEMKIVLARIFQSYRVWVPDHENVKFKFSLTWGPKHGLPLMLIPRTATTTA